MIMLVVVSLPIHSSLVLVLSLVAFRVRVGDVFVIVMTVTELYTAVLGV